MATPPSFTTNQIKGLGEVYTFVDMDLYEADLLRMEFGSFWTDPWSAPTGASSLNSGVNLGGISQAISETLGEEAYAELAAATTFLNYPIFGNSGANPRVKIEFGPAIAVTADFAPYVAHHQQIKLTAKTSVYGFLNPDGSIGTDGSIYTGDCIDCGLIEDVRAMLARPDREPDQINALGQSMAILDKNPTEALNEYFNSTEAGYQYSSMLDPGEDIQGTAITYSNCFQDLITPLNEEDLVLANSSLETGDLTGLMYNGSVSFEYGDYVEYIEEVNFSLEENNIPNFYMLLSGMSQGYLSNASNDYTFFNQAVDYLKGNQNCIVSSAIEEISTGFTDLMVTSGNIPVLNSYNAYKEYFSLRAETSFSTTTESPIADYLSSLSLDGRFLRWLEEKSEDAVKVATGVSFQRIEESLTSKLSFENLLSDGTVGVRTYDFFSWSGEFGEDVFDAQTQEQPASTTGFIGRKDLSVSLALSEDDDAVGLEEQVSASQLILKEALKEHLLTKNLSYQDVFNGQAPYTETLAYKISKYKKDDVSGSSFSFYGYDSGPTNQLEIVQKILKENIEPIQNVWMANVSYSSAVDYVDTQTKYGEDYVFVVWAYTLTLGTKHFYCNFKSSQTPVSAMVDDPAFSKFEFPGDEIAQGYMESGFTSPTLSEQGWSALDNNIRYSDPSGPSSEFYEFDTTDEVYNSDQGPEDDCEITFTATTLPTAMVKELPFFVFAGSILDRPPTKPDVSILPYCGVDNKVLMLLNNSAGTHFAEPVVVNAGEQEIFDKIERSQGIATHSGIASGIIEFGSDNASESYEVYRMMTHPKSYADFSGMLLTTLSTIIDEKTKIKAVGSSYIDSLEPNIKYYYIFRSVDIHGHFSNPTSVFEVELINNGGEVVPSIRVVDLDEESVKDSSKPLKSSLQVVPRISQALVNESESGLTDATANVQSSSSKPILGTEEETIWGKTFKIRLTSRDTKRKIDFNVTFGTEHITNDENFVAPCLDQATPVDPTAAETYVSTLTTALNVPMGGMSGPSEGSY
tara:strand:+ start:47 stop:3127 length:3081 start_codon:yes stop_codon:yes gene_type:complete